MIYNTKPPITRIYEKIKYVGNCWIYTGSKDRYGYGRIGIKLRRVSTHRFMYEYYCGSISPDLELDHLCRNHACCNPEHLEAVSHQVNMHRGNNGMKTHCKNGHEFNPENTYIKKDGSRNCKLCNITFATEYYSKNKEIVKIYNHIPHP